MKNTTVSIIIRNKNNADTLSRAVESALQQTLTPTQVVVVDDNSTDRSLDVLNGFADSITLYTTSGIGAVPALNFGLKKVTSQFYTILDADDALPTYALEKLQTGLQRQPKAVLAYGNYEEYSVTGQRQFMDTSQNIFTTVAGGILFNTQYVRDAGGYDAKLFFPEYDLLIKLTEKHPIVHVPEVVYSYFRHSNSMTADTQRVAEGIQQITIKHGRSFPIRKY